MTHPTQAESECTLRARGVRRATWFARRRSARHGSTLIEILVAVVVIAILARIAIPRYQEVKRKAVAVKIVSDIRTIRLAAQQYNIDSGLWPPNAAPGTMPPVLAPYLPGSLQNFQPDPSYSYVWMVSGEPPSDPSQTTTDLYMMGVGVSMTDPQLQVDVQNLMGVAASYVAPANASGAPPDGNGKGNGATSSTAPNTGPIVYSLISGPGVRP